MKTTEDFDDSKIEMLLFSSVVSSPRGMTGRGAASARATWDNISGATYQMAAAATITTTRNRNRPANSE